jgi:hypothetical protein
MEDAEIIAASALCLLSLNNYVSILQNLRNNNENRRRRRQQIWWMIAIHRNRTL